MYKYKKISLIFFVLFFLLLLIMAISYAHKYRWLERTWFNIQTQSRAKIWQDKSLWLTDYQATIQAKKISGVKNLSGLTYNPTSNTLYTITNKRPEIIELSLDGDIIRRIDASLFKDPEGIEYIENNTYVVADEVAQRISLIDITDTTQSIDSLKSTLSIGIEFIKNKSFEGIVYNPFAKQLLIAKERNPIRLYKVEGFYRDEALTSSPMLTINHQESMIDNLFVTDISGLEIDKKTQHYLVLSHESKILLEVNEAGNVISSLSLNKGQHGLLNGIPQAEGVAIDAEGTIYIVSEPNLFYKFQNLTTIE